jgi:hypothetical protein
MVRRAGARKVYLASASPPVKYPNVYGVDMPSKKEFVANGLTDEQVRRALGLAAGGAGRGRSRLVRCAWAMGLALAPALPARAGSAAEAMAMQAAAAASAHTTPASHRIPTHHNTRHSTTDTSNTAQRDTPHPSHTHHSHTHNPPTTHPQPTTHNPQPTPTTHHPRPPPLQVKDVLGADGLVYQDVEDLLAVGYELNPAITRFDAACFDSHYVTGGWLVAACAAWWRAGVPAGGRPARPAACWTGPHKRQHRLWRGSPLRAGLRAMPLTPPALPPPPAAGDIDGAYLARLEQSGRGASRTRSGQKTNLIGTAASA